MRPAKVIFISAFAFFALPYVLLFRFFSEWRWPEFEEFAWALKNSAIQASGSAVLALIGGLLLWFGLVKAPLRSRAPLCWALLLPSLFPPLFLLLSFLSWMDPFPVGWIGISIIQGFMNAGLVSVLLLQVFDQKLGGLSEAAETLGASRLLFFRKSARLLIPDVLSVGLFVFAASFASFSIPLVVGGGKATTLEILIYEKIRISADWGAALSLSLMQLAIIAAFTLLPRSEFDVSSSRSTNLARWGHSLGLVAVGFYLVLFFGPLLKGLPAGIAAISAIPDLSQEIGALAVPTIFFALLVGLGCFLLFLFFALAAPENSIPRFMRGWLAPSSALLGFAFLFQSGENSWISYVFALILLFFPAVYRLGMDRKIESLRTQVDVARAMGAGEVLIWRKILMPQVWSLAALLSGVGALWAMGEFAVGKVVLGGARTWALLSESLMSSYRIEAGLGVSALILLSGFFVFSFFWGVSHVRR